MTNSGDHLRKTIANRFEMRGADFIYRVGTGSPGVSVEAAERALLLAATEKRIRALGWAANGWFQLAAILAPPIALQATGAPLLLQVGAFVLMLVAYSRLVAFIEAPLGVLEERPTVVAARSRLGALTSDAAKCSWVAAVFWLLAHGSSLSLSWRAPGTSAADRIVGVFLAGLALSYAALRLLAKVWLALRRKPPATSIG